MYTSLNVVGLDVAVRKRRSMEGTLGAKMQGVDAGRQTEKERERGGG